MVPSDDEIHQAVSNLSVDFAPGPDGFGGIFYHMFWDIIKHDVIMAVNQFFTQVLIMRNYNANNIVLITKVKEANTIS